MASIVVGIVGLLASAKTAHHFLKPRLPVYDMVVQGIPSLTYNNGEFQTRIVANVSMRNDNYVKLQIHGVSFDIFYPEWASSSSSTDNNIENKGGTSSSSSSHSLSLIHLGRARDKYQHLARTNEAGEALMNITKSGPPFWSLLPQADFTAMDELYVSLSSLFDTGVLGALSHLLYRIVFETRFGTMSDSPIMLPSTGVMHARANGAAKVTISIVCDNQFDIWTKRMVGVDCIFNSLDVGWLNIEKHADKVRHQALTTFQPNATAGVIALGKEARLKSDQIANKLFNLKKQ